MEGWKAALDLYQGDFLAGFHVYQSTSFDEWMTSQREYLRQLLLTNLYALAEAYEAIGRVDRGLVVLERLLLFEPWSEEAYQKQMLLLVALGKHTEALRRYEFCRQVLADELGATPSPELTALYKELQDTRPSRVHRDQSFSIHQRKSQTTGLATPEIVTSGVTVQTPEPSAELSRTPVEGGRWLRQAQPTGESERLPPEIVTAEVVHREENKQSWALSTNSHIQTPTAIQMRPNNLTHPLSTFIGRTDELAYLQTQVVEPDCRLLTIVGAGGMGKTSLAKALGQRLLQSQTAAFVDGIFFVSLAGIEIVKKNVDRGVPIHHRTDHGTNHGANHAIERGPGYHADISEEPEYHEAIGVAIAEEIGCDFQRQVSSWAQLQVYLRSRQLLLILDNFEQLLDTTDSIVTLLTHAPGLTIVITSRARLNVRGETLLSLNKLSLPSLPEAMMPSLATPEQVTVETDHLFRNGQHHAGNSLQVTTDINHIIEESEAVAMFTQRAQRVDPSFDLNSQNALAVIQICHLVDGLPLGIELAVSMLPFFGVALLAEELTQSLDVLEADLQDLPEDQRKLHTVFHRSWQLLTPEDQLLLAKLSIFPNTFDYQAARTITNASIPRLMSLFNQSLLNRVGDTRYTMHRSIREFARRNLQQWPQETMAVEADFARYYLDILVQSEDKFKGTEQTIVIADISREMDNIRAAWRQAVTSRMVAELHKSMQGLFLFQEGNGLFADGLDLYGHAFHVFSTLLTAQNLPPNHPLMLLVGRLQTYVGWALARLGRFAEAEVAVRTGLSRLEQTDQPVAKVFGLLVLGSTSRAGNLKEAQAFLKEGLAIIPPSREGYQGNFRIFLAELQCLLGHYTEAEQLADEGHKRLMSVDISWGLAQSQLIRGVIQLRLGRYRDAEALFEEGIALTRKRNLLYLLVDSIILCGDALRLQARLDKAAQRYQEGLHLAETYQFPFATAQAKWAQGCLAERVGDYAQAKALLTENLHRCHPSLRSKAMPTLGWALMGLGEFTEAEAYFQRIYEETLETHALPIRLESQAGLAYIAIKHAQQTGATNECQTQQLTMDLQAIAQNPATAAETRQRIHDQIIV
ncbi:MAG: BTAD domain-containing putative transcriptional regulator [Chloroflexota bacterium]